MLSLISIARDVTVMKVLASEVAITVDSLNALASVKDRSTSITAPSALVVTLSVKVYRSFGVAAVTAFCIVVWLIIMVLTNIGLEKYKVRVAVPRFKSKSSSSGSDKSGMTS